MSALTADAAARSRALDLSGSFIVRAPAGSGKTSLLVRRFLRALTTVDRPDQVLAVTFTRKAEHEMRERILRALQDARMQRDGGVELPADPSADDHETAFSRDALRVLDHSIRRGWNLIDQPGQLGVRTLDGLALDIARRSPLSSEFGDALTPVEDAEPLLREAVRVTLHEATAASAADDPLAAAVALLLQRQNNRFEWLEGVCVSLLARREQWLPFLSALAEDDLGPALAAARERLREALMARALTVLAGSDIESLAIDLAQAASRRDDLDAAQCPDPWPGPALAELPAWQGIARLLLTSDGRFRARLTRREGFPPDARESARRVLDWIETRRQADDGAAIAIAQLARLADGSASSDELAALQALGQLLRHIAARLRLLMGRRGECDFTEIGLRALRALQQADYVPDRFQHVLVDEYQDTSRLQQALLTRLVDDWSDGDGRSLFLVGDPMQSIYRFRQAEVGVFLHTETHGLGPVRTQPLSLQANFRSAPVLVAWFNETFRALLPARSDPLTGAVAFAPAVAVRDITGEIRSDWCLEGAAASAADRAIGHVVGLRAADSGARIGVLVRRNEDARRIAAGLQEAGIACDVDGSRDPFECDAVLDLFMLWRSLRDDCDRPAWLAVLRGPLVGLTSADLLALDAAAASANPGGHAPLRPALERLLEPADAPTRAVTDRLPAVRRLLEAHAALATQRWLRPLGLCVRMLWQQLGGWALVPDAQTDRLVRAALAVLDHQDVDATPADVERALRRLGPGDPTDAGPAATASAGAVSVLTVHRAKGLEFDDVVLPHLEGSAPADDPGLLRWLLTDEGLQLALRPPQGDADSGAFALLAALERQQADAELLRLAYVAATRARRSLTLVADSRVDRRGEPSVRERSMLAAFAARMVPPDTTAAEGHDDHEDASRSTLPEPPRTALPALLPATLQLPDWDTARLLRPWTVAGAPDRVEPVDPGRRQWRELGTLVHRLLQQVFEDAADGRPARSWQALLDTGRRLLPGCALTAAEVATLDDPLQRILQRCADCPALDWMRRQTIVGAELDLADKDGRALQADLVIRDDAGAHWIIDFKTVWPVLPVAEIGAQEARYGPQLARYAAALASLRTVDRIRTALYFPAQSLLRELGVGAVPDPGTPGPLW